jgi:hypothetical protein
MITSNSGTMTGGTIHRPNEIAAKKFSYAMRRDRARPSVTVECHEKCGDGGLYAAVLRIASVKAFCAGCGKNAREAPTNHSPRGQDCGGYCSTRSACCFGAERKARMTIRSRREIVTFKHPFRIRGLDRPLPAGAYEVVTDEETIEGLSFEAFRRVATMIKVPVEGRRGLAMEMVSIGSVDLADAQRIDASASDG